VVTSSEDPFESNADYRVNNEVMVWDSTHNLKLSQRVEVDFWQAATAFPLQDHLGMSLYTFVS